MGRWPQLDRKIVVDENVLTLSELCPGILQRGDADCEEAKEVGSNESLPDGHQEAFNTRGKRVQAGLPSKDDPDQPASSGFLEVPVPTLLRAILRCDSPS